MRLAVCGRRALSQASSCCLRPPSVSSSLTCCAMAVGACSLPPAVARRPERRPVSRPSFLRAHCYTAFDASRRERRRAEQGRARSWSAISCSTQICGKRAILRDRNLAARDAAGLIARSARAARYRLRLVAELTIRTIALGHGAYEEPGPSPPSLSAQSRNNGLARAAALAVGAGLLISGYGERALRWRSRRLGRSGFMVPVLTFGTGTFGGEGELFKAWGQTDVAEAHG